jgi:Tol biopolymer transport system component
VSANGGTPQEITKVDATQHTSHRWPYFLPDGKHYLYVAIHHDASKAANNELYYASVDGKENRPLFHAQSNAIYAAGYLLFARGDQLVAQRFDADNGNVSGEPQVVANGVMNDSSTWHVDASAANNGLLVFGTGQSADLQLVWMDRATKEVSTLAGKFSNLQFARISPRGDRIALQIDTGANDIWILDVARGVRTRLTFGPVANIFPVWSPDGQWIAYGASRNGRFALYRKRSDGSGAEELLLQGDTQQLEPNSWSSDGKYLIYTKRAGGGLITIGNGPGQIWVLPLTGDRQPKMLVQQGSGAKLSPDDRWLAYMSAESGLLQVYVVPFSGGQGKWQISSNAGVMPHWSSDGRELLYADPGYNIYAVEVKESGGTIQFGAPRIVVNNWSAPQFFFNLSPDGRKILLDRVSQQVSQYVSVVTNWTAGLK